MRRNTNFSSKTDKETGRTHVLDDTNETVNDLLDTHFGIYYEKQQEVRIEKLIENILKILKRI